LGVSHLVEGSVQRSVNRVRVNAQLIDARTDAHLWAQTYDRDLADVFAIQSEIAKAIADQLQAKILPREKVAIEKQPTKDITAYDLYVQGAGGHRRGCKQREWKGEFFARGELARAGNCARSSLPGCLLQASPGA